MPERRRDIVDVAIEGGFQTLVAAMETAGLLGTLKADGPFTVFAPTDEAFADLPAPTLSRLFAPEHRDELTAVLRYHVVPGRMTSRQIAAVDAASTAHGAEVALSTQVRTMQVNQAMVTRSDLEASNGVVHAIDAVLIPFLTH